MCSCAVIRGRQQGAMGTVFGDVCSALPQPIARHSCRRWLEGGFAALLLAERYLSENQSDCCGSFFVPAVYYCCWRHYRFFTCWCAFFQGRGDEASHSSVYSVRLHMQKKLRYVSLSTILVSLVEAPDRLLSQLFLFACILYITCSHNRSRCFSL